MVSVGTRDLLFLDAKEKSRFLVVPSRDFGTGLLGMTTVALCRGCAELLVES
jgi:hypothetical protein